MTDQTNAPQDVPLEDKKTGLFDRASLIWAVPILALTIALGAAWRNYSDQGPLLSVYFDNAAGVSAGETELRYRDITVGTVETVRFSDELRNVVVEIRVEKDLADYIDAEAEFWVVRPEVTAQGVTGLDTVLSGVYIQGSWDTVPGGFESEFDGMPNSPLLQPDQQGTLFTLRSEENLPGAGTPILYKNVQVGQVGAPLISDDASSVTSQAVIYAPYDGFVSSSTRFWDISGFSFSLGTSGARLNFTSLASLISGGVTFETMGSGGAPLDQNMTFQLYGDEDEARDEFLIAGESDAVEFIMVFEENLAGLSAGAAIELGGLRVGEVANINGIVDRDRFGDDEIRLIATARISASRIGLDSDTDDEALYDFMQARIADGLRARLVNASILTGGLKVQLVVLPNPAPGELDLDAQPYPQIPTAPPEVTDVTATAQGVLQRVNDLPIEEVLQSVRDFLDGATTLIASDDLQAAPTELRGILSAVRGVAESEGVQGAPQQITEFLTTLQSTSATLDGLIATLEDAGAAQSLASALQNTSDTAERLPALLDNLQVVVQNAQDVALDEISTQVTGLLEELNGVIASEGVQQAPAELQALLISLRDVAASEGVQALPQQLTGVLDNLQDVTGDLSEMAAELRSEGAIGNVTQATERLPQLLDDVQLVVQNAQSLPVERLSTQISDLLTQIESLIASEGIQQIPAELQGVLASVRSVTESDGIQGLPQQVTGLLDNLQDVTGDLRDIVAELEASGAQDQLMTALDNLATASEDLPEITAQARAIVGEADGIALDELANRASDLLTAADRLIDQESTRQLPEEINGALVSLQSTLDELRQGGVVENTNAALASARRAADRVAEATDILPQLAADLRRVANSAGTTLSAYSEDSQFSRTTRDAIRQVETAASAIEKLARTIERNPNSLILGR